MKLTKPTDAQLNQAFADKVALWKPTTDGGVFWDPKGRPIVTLPNYVTSADLVLPWLDECAEVEIKTLPGGLWSVMVRKRPDSIGYQNFGDSIPRVAVIALLRANSVEVLP